MPEKPPLFRYTLILIVGVTAVFLLSLSWPRLQASLSYLPVATAMSKYRASREVNKPQLDGLIGRAQQAITLYDHYRYWEGLSELQILSGQDSDKPYWQRLGFYRLQYPRVHECLREVMAAVIRHLAAG